MKEINKTFKVDFEGRKYSRDFPWLETGVMMALASNSTLWDEIDNLYEENELDYLEAFERSMFFDKLFIRMFPSSIETRLIKLLAIYSWKEKRDDEEEFLLYFIKKGYKRYLNHIQNQGVSFSFEKLLQYLYYRKERVPEETQRSVIRIALYIKADELDFEEDGNSDFMRDYVIFPIVMGEENPYSLEEEISSKDKEKIKRVLGFQVKREILISELFTNTYKNLLEKQLVDEQELEPGIYRYFESLNRIIKYLSYDDLMFSSSTTIQRKDLWNFSALFRYSKEFDHLKEEDFELFLTAAILIFMMTKQYRELSEFYKEATITRGKLVAEEGRIKKQKSEIHKTLNDSKRQLDQLQAELQEKDVRIAELESLLKKKELEEKEMESLKKEVVSLREYVFREGIEPSNEDEEEEVTNMATNQEALHDVRIAVVGGHQRWHRRLKEALPKIRTVLPEETNLDLSFVRNMDIVCIETSYNNHTLYRRVMWELKQSRAKIHYMNSQINIHKMMEELVNIHQRA